MTTVGFIGTGNMGSALARAAAKSGLADRILLSNRSKDKAIRLAAEIGGESLDNIEVAAQADYLFLGVKPQMLDGMLEGIHDTLSKRTDRFVIVSMVAGKELGDLRELFAPQPVIRIMPNIPVGVGGGVTLFCGSDEVSDEEKAFLRGLLVHSGAVDELDETLLDAATGITGCGPAFAAIFAEALADGAVACGLPRQKALNYAAQMMKGTAQLLETGEHPAALKDRVCSPGGSTMQGVRTLEESAFRAAVMNAVIAAFEKEF